MAVLPELQCNLTRGKPFSCVLGYKKAAAFLKSSFH